MGGQSKRRKLKRYNDKKFVFGWEDSDDTSVDINPLYNQRKQITMFGRGTIGGIDAREVSGSQVQSERERWMNMHWSEKPLDQMRDRDWRIFKEDFNMQVDKI